MGRAGVLCLLDVGVVAQFGRDAVKLLAADHDHLERRDVVEAEREVRQVVLMEEESLQVLQPADTHCILSAAAYTHFVQLSVKGHLHSNEITGKLTCPCPVADRLDCCCSGPTAAGRSFSARRRESR